RLGNAPGTAPRRPLRHPFTDAASDALRPEYVPFLGTARGGPPAAAASMPSRLRSPAPAARQRPRNGTSENPASSLHGCRFRRPETGERAVPWHGSRRPPGRRRLDADPPALSCSGGSATPPERHLGGPCVIPSRMPLPTPFDRSPFHSLARLAPARRPPPQ